MALTYDINQHTHFNAPEAKGRTAELLHGVPESLILVTEGRVWFHSDYLLLQVEGVKQESPFDDMGSCVMSYPAEGCNFFTATEAEDIAELSAADDLLRGQSGGGDR